MKAAKIILIILASIFVLWLIASALMPSHCHLERTIVINAPPRLVFEQVNNLKNWQKWSYWDQLDPEAKKVYEGPESGPGSRYSWDGKKVKKGSMLITESHAPETIKTDLDFSEQGKAQAAFKFEPADGGTKVTWSFDSDVGFSQRVFMALMIDKFLGESYEKSLANLKEVVENALAESNSEIGQVDLTRQWVITQRETTDLAGIPATLSAAFENVTRFAMANGLSQNGQPLAIWHKFNPADDFVDVEAGIPVSDSTNVGTGMKLIKLSGKAVKTTHWGDYDSSEITYHRAMNWMNQQGIQPSGPPWEVYVTDPEIEKDTAKWQTDIYFPI